MLSIIIITYNEEKNIERAIKSSKFADEIIVVDSYSTDNTCQIAKDLKAKVFQNKFKGYGNQKNYAITKCSNQWIFSLDADEEITEELQIEILSTIKKNENNYIYSVNRKTFFNGKWIKYGGWCPDYVSRLFKVETAKWNESNVHESLIPKDGSLPNKLNSSLNHFSFPTFMSQINTNIRYAKLGAKTLIETSNKPSIAKVVLKPLGKFIECYFIKKGFLDGKEGFFIAINASYSMYMKYSFAYFDEY